MEGRAQDDNCNPQDVDNDYCFDHNQHQMDSVSVLETLKSLCWQCLSWLSEEIENEIEMRTETEGREE